MKKITLVFSFLFLLTACSAPVASPAPTPTIGIATPFNTVIPPSETPTSPAIDAQPAQTATILTADALATMTPDQKLAAAPVSLGEFTRSHIGTMNLNWVLYEKDEVAGMAYDLLTGESMKIIEFDLTDGTKLEMRRFATTAEAKSYLDKVAMRYTDGSLEKRMSVLNSWFNTPESGVFLVPIKKIPGWKPIYDLDTPRKRNNWYPVAVDSVDNGDLLEFMPNEKVYEAIFVEGGTDKDLLLGIQGGAMP